MVIIHEYGCRVQLDIGLRNDPFGPTVICREYSTVGYLGDVILVVQFLLDEFRSVISQHALMSCEFPAVWSDVPVGICNGCLGQQFLHVSGACC